MPRYERATLWDTLKEVQINITDPLPYQADVNNILKQALNRDDAIDLVRQRAVAKDPFAIDILEKLNNQTAERILLDAPSRTLSWSIYFSQRYAGGYGLRSYMGDIGVPGPPDHEVDISRLKGSKPGSIVRAATEWASKSASAFSDAIDACFTHPYLHHHPALNPVYKALRECHAFDQGNQKYIDLMEDERKEIAHEMSYHAYWQEIYPMAPYRGDVDSRKSYFVQAADLAGGIAGYLYEHGGVFTVTLNFEYVMFNGKRISQNEAYETMKIWQELGYFS
jgi:hypothetical protein